jgi:hypothetical protein
MSIATEEAERKYPAFSGDMKRRSLNMPFHIGYVNGRTAPVTEAEIEAATLAASAFDAENPVIDDIDNYFRCLSNAVLSAARKQVTQ